jgi:hypothetical protein
MGKLSSEVSKVRTWIFVNLYKDLIDGLRNNISSTHGVMSILYIH